jgi:hypothetical protein
MNQPISGPMGHMMGGPMMGNSMMMNNPLMAGQMPRDMPSMNMNQK